MAPLYHLIPSVRVNCGVTEISGFVGLGSWTLQGMEQLPGDPRPELVAVSMPFLLCPCLSKCGPHISSTVYPRNLARNSNSRPGPGSTEAESLQLKLTLLKRESHTTRTTIQIIAGDMTLSVKVLSCKPEELSLIPI